MSPEKYSDAKFCIHCVVWSLFRSSESQKTHESWLVEVGSNLKTKKLWRGRNKRRPKKDTATIFRFKVPYE